MMVRSVSPDQRGNLYPQGMLLRQDGLNKRYHIGVAIKNEPECPPQLGSQSPSASLKRRRSEEPEDPGGKRQRVASISTVDDDIGALFAQAAAAAARHIEESSTDTVQNDVGDGQSEKEKPPMRTSNSNPQSRLLTRVLSLPMLESLASCKTVLRDTNQV
jgi:hypothetical protein